MTDVLTIEKLVEDLINKRKEIDSKKEELSALNREFRGMEASAIELLTELDLKDYKGKHGTIKRETKWSVKVPQSDQDKAKLFDYLRVEGIFDRYATVNSRSIQTLYMEKWDRAKEEGRGMEFSLPGIEQPTSYEDLGLRKR